MTPEQRVTAARLARDKRATAGRDGLPGLFEWRDDVLKFLREIDISASRVDGNDTLAAADASSVARLTQLDDAAVELDEMRKSLLYVVEVGDGPALHRAYDTLKRFGYVP